MFLKLMYVTNDVFVAQTAEASGVDRIFIDFEYIGKSERQCGLDTVMNHHTVADVVKIKEYLKKAELLVRVNPIHEASAEYGSSLDEINAVIHAGADIVMLPYFKTVAEVREFISCVDGRAKTMLLFETPEAVTRIDEILSVDGIDEVFIGLNDLSLGYGKGFMFELLADGTVDKLCNVFRAKGLPYGFGGIASLGKGLLPSEYVIQSHYKLGSSSAILSRSFCNLNRIEKKDEIESIFFNGVKEIREFEQKCMSGRFDFEESEVRMKEIVAQIVADMKE